MLVVCGVNEHEGMHERNNSFCPSPHLLVLDGEGGGLALEELLALGEGSQVLLHGGRIPLLGLQGP